MYSLLVFTTLDINRYYLGRPTTVDQKHWDLLKGDDDLGMVVVVLVVVVVVCH